MYFHKLNFYLNQTPKNQAFIIHLTSYIYWLTNKDTRLSTSGKLVHWVRVRGLHLSYTIHLFRSAHISNLGYSLSRSVPISNLRYSSHMHRVNPYVLFRSAHISNLGYGHMNLLRLFTSNLHHRDTSLDRSNLETMHVLIISTQHGYLLSWKYYVSITHHIIHKY